MTFVSGAQWSGNKNGRPKGSGHRQQLFNSLVEPHCEKLFETAINLALAGNEAMLRLFLERMLPSRPVDDEISITQEIDGKRTKSLLELGNSILKAVAQAEITPDQGSSLMAVIDSQRRNIETCEIDLRLKEVQRTLKQRQPDKRKK